MASLFRASDRIALNPTVPIRRITMLGDELLISCRMIKLMSSEVMVGALMRVRDVKAVDDIK